MPRLLALAAGLVSAFVLAGSAAAGAAQTPSAYRASLNSLCRANTVKIKALASAMKRAQQANDPTAYGVALGQVLVITLRQDGRIRATAVPAQLRTAMTTTNRLLANADAVIVKLIQDAAAGRAQQMLAGFTSLERMAPSINRHLDAAGLRDCGSNQA